MKRSLNLSAVGFGAFFVVLGIMGLVDELGGWDLEIGYVVPAVLIVAGVVLTVASLTTKEPR